MPFLYLPGVAYPTASSHHNPFEFVLFLVVIFGVPVLCGVVLALAFSAVIALVQWAFERLLDHWETWRYRRRVARSAAPS